MTTQNVDLRTVNKGYATVAAAETALSGIDNAGKFAITNQGGIRWVSLNIAGNVGSIPDLRAALATLQAQVDAISSGITGQVVQSLYKAWGVFGTPYGQFDFVYTMDGSNPVIWMSDFDDNNDDPSDPAQTKWETMPLDTALTYLFKKP